MKVIFSFAAFVLSFAVPAFQSYAATYYSSPSGSDANPGDKAHPFKTIKKGARLLTPGDALFLLEGTYYEELGPSDIPGGESWDKPVTIAAEVPRTATLKKPTTGTSEKRLLYFGEPTQKYIIVSGIIFDATGEELEGIRISFVDRARGGAHHIRIKDSEVKHAGSNGITIHGDNAAEHSEMGVNHNELINVIVHHNGDQFPGPSRPRADWGELHGIYIATSDNLVQGCTVYANPSHGIHIYSAVATRGNRVIGNKVYDSPRVVGAVNGGWGIGIYRHEGGVVANNILWNNHSADIKVDLSSSNTQVYGNTMLSRTDGHSIDLGREVSRTSIHDNVIYGASSPNNGVNAARGNTWENNWVNQGRSTP